MVPSRNDGIFARTGLVNEKNEVVETKNESVEMS
jgi:hypothetical protein